MHVFKRYFIDWIIPEAIQQTMRILFIKSRNVHGYVTDCIHFIIALWHFFYLFFSFKSNHSHTALSHAHMVNENFFIFPRETFFHEGVFFREMRKLWCKMMWVEMWKQCQFFNEMSKFGELFNLNFKILWKFEKF